MSEKKVLQLKRQFNNCQLDYKTFRDLLLRRDVDLTNIDGMFTRAVPAKLLRRDIVKTILANKQLVC